MRDREERLAFLVRIAACAIVVGIGAWITYRASALVDGKRFFWLDDDQMISMRYARNLVAGDGLVFNPHERVEGFTNPGWVLVMALVHLLPIDEAIRSVVVKAIAIALSLVVFRSAERLYIALRSGDEPARVTPLIVAALWLPLATCANLLLWTVNGFEVPLLTALYVGALAKLCNAANTESPSARRCIGAFVAVGALPLVRSDAWVLLAGALVVAWTTRARRDAVTGSALALAIASCGLIARRIYFGNWVPNTYYLKVEAIPGLAGPGLAYAIHFARDYGLLLFAAAAGLAVTRDPRRRALAVGICLSLAYVVSIGGDMYNGYRFLAHEIPVLLVLALLGAEDVAGAVAGARFTRALVALSVVVVDGVVTPGGLARLRSENGMPESAIGIAVALARNSEPSARVAVAAAGIVPYFSHRYAIDLLGKCDPYVAHSAPHPPLPGKIGHSKFDYPHSLAARPDFIVWNWPQRRAAEAPLLVELMSLETTTYGISLLLDPTFRADYLPNRVSALLEGNLTLYVAATSPERQRIAHWQIPRVTP